MCVHAEFYLVMLIFYTLKVGRHIPNCAPRHEQHSFPRNPMNTPRATCTVMYNGDGEDENEVNKYVFFCVSCEGIEVFDTPGGVYLNMFFTKIILSVMLVCLDMVNTISL